MGTWRDTITKYTTDAAKLLPQGALPLHFPKPAVQSQLVKQGSYLSFFLLLFIFLPPSLLPSSFHPSGIALDFMTFLAHVACPALTSAEDTAAQAITCPLCATVASSVKGGDDSVDPRGGVDAGHCAGTQQVFHRGGSTRTLSGAGPGNKGHTLCSPPLSPFVL